MDNKNVLRSFPGIIFGIDKNKNILSYQENPEIVLGEGGVQKITVLFGLNTENKNKVHM